MKVLLLKDIPKIGKKGDVKEVNQGHAMNFLLPRKLAKAVNDSQVSQLKVQKEKQKEEELLQKDIAIKSVASLKGKTIVLKERSNDKGHLFSQIHKDEIQKAINNQLGVSVSLESILLDHPIKEIGESNIKLKIYDVSVEIILKVESL